MRLAIGFRPSGEDDWEGGARFAADAEAAGVDVITTAETWGYDAATPVGYLAAFTRRAKLATGIMQVASRSPANIAMISMALNAMSKGRFICGLGASGPQVVEGWHGVPFKGTQQRLRETIEIVRIISRGERAAYNGKYFTLPLPGGEGKALRSGAKPTEFPIYLATLSPKGLGLTGELADGWFGTSFIPEHADVFTNHIAAGAAKTGRSLKDITLQVAAGVVQFSDDVEKLIPPRRPGLAFTLGAMGSAQHNFYNDAYKRAGYDEEARYVQRLWLEGKREEAAAAVPDEMVLKTNLIGTERMIRDRVRTHRDAGINTLAVQIEGGSREEKLNTLERLSAIVREEAPEA